jgi:two-component system chemotaxis response regulator CheY
MVFLDLVMPAMDGLTFLEAVRRMEERRGIPKGSGLKIVITSAVNDGKSIKAAETYQVLEYIVKPFSRESVEECVKKHAGL